MVNTHRFGREPSAPFRPSHYFNRLIALWFRQASSRDIERKSGGHERRGFDRVSGTTEFTAGTDDAVVIGQSLAFRLRISAQDLRNAAAVAAAMKIQRLGRMHPH